jgi:hypothetical protein
LRYTSQGLWNLKQVSGLPGQIVTEFWLNLIYEETAAGIDLVIDAYAAFISSNCSE